MSISMNFTKICNTTFQKKYKKLIELFQKLIDSKLPIQQFARFSVQRPRFTRAGKLGAYLTHILMASNNFGMQKQNKEDNCFVISPNLVVIGFI